jgi:hypothetical protein
MTHWSQPADRSASGPLRVIDCARKLVQIGVVHAQEPSERVPAKTTHPTLDARDERGIGAQLLSDLFLRHPRLVAKGAQGATEDELILLGGRLLSFAWHQRTIASRGEK